MRLPKRDLSESTTGPPRGAFSFGEIEWERNGGMNTADVSDARPSIGHKEGSELLQPRLQTASSVRPRAFKRGAAIYGAFLVSHDLLPSDRVRKTLASQSIGNPGRAIAVLGKL